MELKDKLIIDIKNYDQFQLLSNSGIFNLIKTYKIGVGISAEIGIDDLNSTFGMFLDFKLYDTPDSVFNSIKLVLDFKPKYITIHIAGGMEMMNAAMDAASGSDTKILGVALLSSQDEKSLLEMGINERIWQAFTRLYQRAGLVGLDGVIAPYSAIKIARNCIGKDKIIITPGIRMVGHDVNDHKLYCSPFTAISQGADAIVVGRPILQSSDPVGTAHEYLDAIKGVAGA